jgi:hypothetical protein
MPALWSLVLTPSALAADCEQTTKAFEREIDAAELAFAAVDEATFAEAEGRATAAIPCLVEPLAPEEAAAYHRIRGLRAFTLGDRAEAALWFRAAHVAEPDYTFPAQLVPDGGPVDKVWEEAVSAGPSGKFQRLEPPRGSHTLVDGQKSDARPMEIPAIVQLVEGDDVGQTALLRPGDPLPDALTGGADPKESKGGRGGYVAAAVTGVVAGGLWAGSAVSRSSYDADPTAQGRQLTNGLWFGSVGLGATAVGLAGFAAVSGSF